MDGIAAIGLDLDGGIDEAPHFFAPLSKLWPAAVYVVTSRRDYERAKQYFDTFGIRYSEIILVARFEDKAIVIKDKSIGVCFDDQDEMLMQIPDDVVVMKIQTVKVLTQHRGTGCIQRQPGGKSDVGGMATKYRFVGKTALKMRTFHRDF
jgi:hypothetical protein